jgi:hypothetical protein
MTMLVIKPHLITNIVIFKIIVVIKPHLITNIVIFKIIVVFTDGQL